MSKKHPAQGQPAQGQPVPIELKSIAEMPEDMSSVKQTPVGHEPNVPETVPEGQKQSPMHQGHWPAQTEVPESKKE
jgi:hypothetical protein